MSGGRGGRRVLVAGACLWGAGVQAGEAFAAAGMGLALVGAVWAGAPGLRRPRALAAAFWPVWLYIGWALLAPLLGGGRPTWGGFFRTLDWAFVPVGAAAFAAMDGRGRRAVAVACGAALLASCLAAGLQFFGAWPGREAMRPLAFLYPAFERVYEPASAGSTSHFMGGGLLFHRLKFAGVSGVFSLWAVALAARLRGRERTAAAAVAVAALVSVLVFPVVRAAALALLLAAAFTAALASERRRAALALGAGFLLLGAAAVGLNPEMRARVAAASHVFGDEDRVHLRRAGLAALSRHPLVGMGAGRFRASDFMAPDAPRSVKNHKGKAHLQPFSVAVEAGVPGAALFLLMLGWMGVRLWRGGAVHPGARAAGLGALLFLGIMSVLHDPLFHAETSMAFAFALAAALGCQAPGPPDSVDFRGLETTPKDAN